MMDVLLTSITVRIAHIVGLMKMHINYIGALIMMNTSNGKTLNVPLNENELALIEESLLLFLNAKDWMIAWSEEGQEIANLCYRLRDLKN